MITCKRNGYPFITAYDPRPEIPLVGLGDFHLGAKTFNGRALDERIAWVERNQAYWIGMGDLMECANRFSPGAGVYEQTMIPDEQIETLITLLRPIAPWCLGMVKGNHEERVYKTTGIDPLNTICRELKVNYCGWEAIGMIATENSQANHGCAYSFYAVHSYTGNKTTGLALNWIEREIDKWMVADLVFRAHSHDVGFDPKVAINIDKQNHVIREEYRYAIMTGHFMDRFDSYIAARAGKPKPVGTVGVWLNMDRRHRKVRPEYLL